jgi:hypothetical protein
MKKYQRRCPACSKKFEVYNTKKSRGALGKYKRPKTAVTCSPDCSKVYNRCISTYRSRAGLNYMDDELGE